MPGSLAVTNHTPAPRNDVPNLATSCSPSPIDQFLRHKRRGAMTDQDASPPPNFPPQRATRQSSSPYRDADALHTPFLSTAAPSPADAELQVQTRSKSASRGH